MSLVGIGTNNPTSELQVNGAGTFTNSIFVGEFASSPKKARINVTQSLPNKSGLIIKLTNSSSPTFAGVGIKIM